MNIDRPLIISGLSKAESEEQMLSTARDLKQNGMTILQTQRWDGILNKRIEQGAKLEISEEMVKWIFKSIHLESINKQETILSRK